MASLRLTAHSTQVGKSRYSNHFNEKNLCRRGLLLMFLLQSVIFSIVITSSLLCCYFVVLLCQLLDVCFVCCSPAEVGIRCICTYCMKRATLPLNFAGRGHQSQRCYPCNAQCVRDTANTNVSSSVSFTGLIRRYINTVLLLLLYTTTFGFCVTNLHFPL